MTAGGVIPAPEDRQPVYHVGSVQDMSGVPLHVGVNGGAVTIGGFVLDAPQLETFAQLLVRACWLAGLATGR
jgi:hypothetical protein